MTFAEMVAQLSYECFPSGESENLIAIHRRFFIEALYDLQKNISCVRANNVNVLPQCASYFRCGMTVVPKPRGHILSVSVIDKLDAYTGLESADADEDWCSEITYQQVDFCRLSSYQRLCEQCSTTASLASSLSSIVSSVFGIFRIKRRYPAPTDAGFESAAPLQEGYHYGQASTDATGRSPSGVWANKGDQIHVAPWIQSTEALVIRWNGIKRNWSDADLVDDDPKFLQAVRAHVSWQHEKSFGDKDMAKMLYAELWGTPQTTGTVGLIPDLIHECHEENRKRSCDEAMGAGTGGGGARGMAPTSTSGGAGTIYFNERQVYTASCPAGQTGDSVTVIKEAGTVQSVLSVADANAQAIASAQSEANSRLVCEDSAATFLNTPQTATATCPEASDGVPAAEGNPVTVTVLAGRYSSEFSQQAADDAALAAAQSQAEAQLSCTYWNEAQTYTAECPAGTVGSDVTVTVAAGIHSSTLSQEDANALALAAAQSQAEEQLSCGADAFLVGNTPQSGQASVTCAPSGCAPLVINRTIVIPANTYTQMTTTALMAQTILALNQQALTIANFQAQVSANNQCTTYSVLCGSIGGGGDP